MFTFPTTFDSLQSVTFEQWNGIVNMVGSQLKCAKMKHFSNGLNSTHQQFKHVKTVLGQRLCFDFMIVGSLVTIACDLARQQHHYRESQNLNGQFLSFFSSVAICNDNSFHSIDFEWRNDWSSALIICVWFSHIWLGTKPFFPVPYLRSTATDCNWLDVVRKVNTWTFQWYDTWFT